MGQNALTSPPGFVATQSSVATKTDTPILEMPQSVSVVTRDELTNRNVQTDPQALFYTPGIWSQPFGGDQNLNNPFYVIRGFQSAFGGSYVDSLVSPVNYHYEPFGIERYDILRGPSSSLYGQADPGGLVNRTSKRPTTDFQGEVQLETGNFGRGQAAADISGPVDARTARPLPSDRPGPRCRCADRLRFRRRRHPTIASSWRRRSRSTSAPTHRLTLLGSYLKDKTGQESVVLFDTGDLTHVNLGKNNFDYEHQQGGYDFRHRFNDCATAHAEPALSPTSTHIGSVSSKARSIRRAGRSSASSTGSRRNGTIWWSTPTCRPTSTPGRCRTRC